MGDLVNGVVADIEWSTCLLRPIVNNIICEYADIRLRCLVAKILTSPAVQLIRSRQEAKQWLPEFLCPRDSVDSFSEFLDRQWDRPEWDCPSFANLVSKNGRSPPFLQFEFMVPGTSTGGPGLTNKKGPTPFTQFYNRVFRPTCPRVLYWPITVFPTALYENESTQVERDMFDVIVQLSEKVSLLWICTGSAVAFTLYPLHWSAKEISHYWTNLLFERLAPNSTVIVDIQLHSPFTGQSVERFDPATDKRLIVRFPA
jgi:hypothetical protein